MGLLKQINTHSGIFYFYVLGKLHSSEVTSCSLSGIDLLLADD